jgi:hypothetical protein
MGLASRTVASREELKQVVESPIETPELVEIITKRSAILDHHTVVRKAVALALAGSEHVEERP